MKKILYSLLASVFLLIDFLVKKTIIVGLKGTSGIRLINGILEIVYLENKGAAFGILNHNRHFLIITVILMLVSLFYLLLNTKINNRLFLVSCSLAIGGGAGNLLDRFIYGYVIDYIKLSFFPPICNLADYFITAGISGIAFYVVFLSDKQDSTTIFRREKWVK